MKLVKKTLWGGGGVIEKKQLFKGIKLQMTQW